MKSFSLKAILAAAVALSAAGAQATNGVSSLTNFTSGTYTLTFAGDGSGSLDAVAYITGNISSITLDGFSFDFISSKSKFELDPLNYLGNTHTLKVVGTGSIRLGHVDYDDTVVSSGMPTISNVPEPETLAMMLAGLVMVGSMARRRRVQD